MPVSNPNPRAGVSLGVQEPYPPATPVQHGETSQTSRAMALGSYFLSGVMAYDFLSPLVKEALRTNVTPI